MDGNHYSMHGGTSFLVSLGGVIFLFISSHDIGDILKGIAAVVSIAAGVMAFRYYYYAIKEKKQNLKNNARN